MIPELSNRYRIDGLLGRGGMAHVYRGTDLVLGRTVAIKVLSEQMAADPQSVRRFRREAQAAAGLSHPGIVAVYDTGSDGEIHYIVMEHVKGRTLADVLRENVRLQPERAVEIVDAVASALSQAHGKGIIHRDVKPGNVMITPSGDVKVMDFGIARASSAEPLTRTTTVLGTATYLSPEQARGELVDARSDLYALGVVLYEMIAGRPPFVGDSPVAVAYQHVREDPEPPSRLNPNIDPGLEAVVLKAMAKDRAVRYQTAEELRSDLRRFRAGEMPAGTRAGTAGPITEPIPVEGTTVLPRTPPRRLSGGPRWTPWLIALGTLLALSLIAAIVLSTRTSRPPGGAGGTSPSNPATSPSDATRTPPPETPLSVENAVAALNAILNQGMSNGDVSRRAGEEIARDVNGALKDYEHGKLDKSIGKLDKLQDRVRELANQGEISGDRPGQIRQGIIDLEAALRAAPPSDGEGGD